MGEIVNIDMQKSFIYKMVLTLTNLALVGEEFYNKEWKYVHADSKLVKYYELY